MELKKFASQLSKKEVDQVRVSRSPSPHRELLEESRLPTTDSGVVSNSRHGQHTEDQCPASASQTGLNPMFCRAVQHHDGACCINKEPSWRQRWPSTKSIAKLEETKLQQRKRHRDLKTRLAKVTDKEEATDSPEPSQVARSYHPVDNEVSFRVGQNRIQTTQHSGHKK